MWLIIFILSKSNESFKIELDNEKIYDKKETKINANNVVIEKMKSQMNTKTCEFEEVILERRALSSKILELREKVHRRREKLNSKFYDTKTRAVIMKEMPFDDVQIPADDHEIGNISELYVDLYYSDSSPQEDEYLEISEQLSNSLVKMAVYDTKFIKLDKEIRKCREDIEDKIDDINQAIHIELKKRKSESDLQNDEINQNEIEQANETLTADIQEFISNQFLDTSPDDQEYKDVKTDVVKKIKDQIDTLTEIRKKITTTKPETTSATTKKSVYGAQIQSSSFKRVVSLALKEVNKVTTSLTNQTTYNGDQYQSFRDEHCDEDCKLDCKCKMQSMIAIK